MVIPVFSSVSKPFTWPDGSHFHQLAVNLLTGNGYSTSISQPFLPSSTITPGYPIFILGLYSVFGTNPYVVVVAQIILSFLLISGIALVLKTNKLTTVIFLLLSLCFAFYSIQIMADILFLTFFIPGVFLAMQLFGKTEEELQKKGAFWKKALGSGLLFGFGALVKPIGLYFPLLLAFLFLIRKPSKHRLAAYGVLLLAHVMIVAPWFVRNKLVFNRATFSTIQSFNLSHIHAAPIKSSIDNISLNEAEALLEKQAFVRYGKPKNEADKFIYTAKESLRYILNYPGRYALLYASGIAKTFLPLGFAEFLLFYSSSDIKISNLTPRIQKAFLDGRIGSIVNIIWEERIKAVGWAGLIYILGLGFKLFLIAAALFGFFRKGYGRFKSVFNFLVFISVLYFIGVTGPAGQPRHFLPVLPFMAILAARAFRKTFLQEFEGLP